MAAAKRNTLLLADYFSSDTWNASGASKESVQPILETFLEICTGEMGAAVEKLGHEELRQILLERLPPRLGREQKDAGQSPVLIGKFLEWIGEENLNADAWKFSSVIEEAREQFPALMKDHGGTQIPATKGTPYERPGEKVGRNDPCPCGSGKKYKKCCFRALG